MMNILAMHRPGSNDIANTNKGNGGHICKHILRSTAHPGGDLRPHLEFLVVPGARRARGVGPLKQEQLCENYHAKHGEEHDEYEETDVGALLRAVRGRPRAPPHRADSSLAWAR